MSRMEEVLSEVPHADPQSPLGGERNDCSPLYRQLVSPTGTAKVVLDASGWLLGGMEFVSLYKHR